MTIDDQIRDEKLQYDIKRKAAKLSGLPSGKFDKHEYLTHKDILPSNQQQIKEQAKFTYYPLGKAFEKQIKTIENQGEKHIKVIQDQGQVKTINRYTYDAEDTPLISKQKEIFNKLIDERLEEITDLEKKVDDDDLIYRYKGRAADAKFDKFDHALDILDKIKNGEISLGEAKNDQEKFKFNLGEIRRGNSKRRSKEQKNALYNIEMLYKATKRAY